MENKLISKQIKAARMLLGWSQQDLIKITDLSEPTIARAESMSAERRVNKSSLNLIVKSLENHGITFIDNLEEKGCLGVALFSEE